MAILDESIRRKLSQLMLVGTKVRAGAIKGERRSTKRGTSIEFADYRNYTPGDDLRRLDWNVYARTERPYVKLLEDEEDLAVHIILDASRSMDWPEQDDLEGLSADANKLLFGKRLMAGLAFISLNTNDQLSLQAVSLDRVDPFGPVRGRGQSLGMLRYVDRIKANGVTDLNTTLQTYAVRARRPGLTFVITDMFSPSGYLDGLTALQGHGHEVVLLHVLSPDEMIPPQVGDLRLIDVETGTPQEVSMDGSMRELYVRRVLEWREEIRLTCARRGVFYLPLVTEYAWEKVILYDLRRLGLVR